MNVDLSLDYGGYTARIVWDRSTQMWHGRILGLDIEFANAQYHDVIDQFHTIVEQYLAGNLKP